MEQDEEAGGKEGGIELNSKAKRQTEKRATVHAMHAQRLGRMRDVKNSSGGGRKGDERVRHETCQRQTNRTSNHKSQTIILCCQYERANMQDRERERERVS